ncbi:hypothetical protein C8J57DRAFT_223589 [Mycena rebaudengoi]|nr:hypothetical protein C8J57DRAFT_223589 [Mycena rebaudengoi]
MDAAIAARKAKAIHAGLNAYPPSAFAIHARCLRSWPSVTHDGETQSLRPRTWCGEWRAFVSSAPTTVTTRARTPRHHPFTRITWHFLRDWGCDSVRAGYFRHCPAAGAARPPPLIETRVRGTELPAGLASLYDRSDDEEEDVHCHQHHRHVRHRDQRRHRRHYGQHQRHRRGAARALGMSLAMEVGIVEGKNDTKQNDGNEGWRSAPRWGYGGAFRCPASREAEPATPTPTAADADAVRADDEQDADEATPHEVRQMLVFYFVFFFGGGLWRGLASDVCLGRRTSAHRLWWSDVLSSSRPTPRRLDWLAFGAHGDVGRWRTSLVAGRGLFVAFLFLFIFSFT